MKYIKNYCEEKGISTSKLNEAQRTLYYIAENMKMDRSISEEGYKHFQMAIKALEQEPVLDKIRAEIEQLRNFRAENYDLEQYCDCFDARIIFRDDVFEIIDKYKSESEDE